MAGNIERIKTRILVPVAFALLFMLAGAVFSIYWLKQQSIGEDVNHETNEVQEIFPTLLEAEAKIMAGQIAFLKENQNLQNAWIAKDRDALLRYAAPIFEQVRSAYGVTHFYFMGLDRSCFLRMHNPTHYGDTIERFTMEHAVQQGKLAYGLELGLFGTFTLRAVTPWRIGGQLAGYIELGKEIDHIMPLLKDILGIEYFLTIKKRFLTRLGWEEGLRMMKRKGNWDTFKDVVIIDQSIKEIPSGMASMLSGPHENNKELSINPNGVTRRCRAAFLPLTDAGGRPVGEIILFIDVTEQENSMRMYLIIQLAVCGFISLLLFTSFYSYISRIENSIVKVNNNLRTKIADHTQSKRELKKYRDHLKELVEERTTNLKNSNEQLQQEIMVRRRTQEELQRLNEELEKRVEARTGELVEANDALFRKEKLAVLGQLASGVGHELRNPLGVIKNACYFLNMKLKTSNDEALVDNINIIKREIATADKIVSDILDFSRFKQPMCEDVNLNQLVKDTLSRTMLQDNIEVITDFSEDMAHVSIDPAQAGQIFFNLIENAGQAMEEGGILRIYTKINNLTAEVGFEDEGCGISEDRLEKIFEPLFTTKKKGIGLGLAICKSLAEANGGTILVESREGKGSTFTVRFQRKD